MRRRAGPGRAGSWRPQLSPPTIHCWDSLAGCKSPPRDRHERVAVRKLATARTKNQGGSVAYGGSAERHGVWWAGRRHRLQLQFL